MTRRSTAKLALVTLLPFFATGCLPPVEAEIALEREFDLMSDGSSIAHTEMVDLFEESPDLKENRDQIDALTIDSIEATVTAVPEDNAAAAVSGSVEIGGVVVGSFENAPVQVGSAATALAGPALDKAVMDAVKGDGKIALRVTGTASGAPLHFVLKVKMVGRAEASIGLGDLF